MDRGDLQRRELCFRTVSRTTCIFHNPCSSGRFCFRDRAQDRKTRSSYLKTVHISLRLFVGGLISYLHFYGVLCIVVSKTYCVLCLFLFFCSSCVSYATSFFGLCIFIAPSVFSNVYLSCVLCNLCYQFLWIVHFCIAPSVFSNVYLHRSHIESYNTLLKHIILDTPCWFKIWQSVFMLFT